MAYIQPDSPLMKMSSNEKKAGMTTAEKAKYKRETGGTLKSPQPEGGSRKKSYCARSAGIKKCKNPDEKGMCPNDYSRRKWKCGKK